MPPRAPSSLVSRTAPRGWPTSRISGRKTCSTRSTRCISPASSSRSTRPWACPTRRRPTGGSAALWPAVRGTPGSAANGVVVVPNDLEPDSPRSCAASRFLRTMDSPGQAAQNDRESDREGRAWRTRSSGKRRLTGWPIRSGWTRRCGWWRRRTGCCSPASPPSSPPPWSGRARRWRRSRWPAAAS